MSEVPAAQAQRPAPSVASTATAEPDPDAELMLALQGGRDTALNQLMERWQGPLIAFFTRSTGRPEEAADLAQETFVRVYASRARYRPSGKFPTWLFTIAANLARNFARWRSRHPEVELSPGGSETGALLPGEIDHALPGDDLLARERARAVRDAIRTLPEEMREALILFTYHDLAYREIARIQRTNEKTVENRLYRGRLLLKEKLAGLMER